MASEEGNVGKDFALEEKMKEKFEKEILQLINNVKGNTITYNNFTYNIQINEKNGSIDIKIGETTLASITNGEFKYNVNGLEALKERLEKSKEPAGTYKDLGLPDLDYLKYLEKENQKRENVESRDENELEHPDKLKEEEEEKNEKDEDLKEKEDEENIILDSNDGKQKFTKKGDWVELNTNVRITANKTIADLLETGKYSKVYVAPTADYSNFKILGETQDSYEELGGLEQTEGNNPTQNITTLDSSKDSNVEIKQTNMMLKIKNRPDEGISIARGEAGYVEVNYWRKTCGDSYISTAVPVSGRDGDIEHTSPETRYYMSSEYTNHKDIEKACEASETIKSIQERGLPEEIDPTANGVQFEEISLEKFKANMKELIKKQLDNENYGHPDAREGLAEKMTNLIVDEGMSYEESKDEIGKSPREEGGKTPGDNGFDID